MKLLLSINSNYYDKPVEEIFKTLEEKDKEKIIGGIELKIDYIENTTLNYAKCIAKELETRNMAFQIHAKELDEDLQNEFKMVDIYNMLSNIYGNKVKITYHPYKYENDAKDSLYKTKIVLSKIARYIEENKYNLEMCIENLDNVRRYKGLNIEDLSEIVNSLDNTYITYDIGHEIVENICTYSVPIKLESKVNNIHIHDIQGFNTHFPFIYGNIDLDRTFSYCKWINYSGNIVLQISLEYLEGDTFEEKMDNYIGEFYKLEKYIKKYNL